MTDTLIPSVPAVPAPSTPGTIDVTNLVESMRETWVAWAVNLSFVTVTSLPVFSWLGWPGLSNIFKAFLNWLFNLISTSAEQEAFYMNTAVKKASQAIAYINSVQAKNGLPPTASYGEYYAAEQSEISAFSSFVRITS